MSLRVTHFWTKGIIGRQGEISAVILTGMPKLTGVEKGKSRTLGKPACAFVMCGLQVSSG